MTSVHSLLNDINFSPIVQCIVSLADASLGSSDVIISENVSTDL